MEDDKSTETSTNEEALDVEAELEESEFNFDSEDDNDSEEQTESEESDEDESANESAEETEEESEEDATEEGLNEEPADVQAERKRHNDEMARKRIAEREARQQAKRDAEAASTDKAYQDAYEKALDAGKDERAARHEASQALTLKQLQIDAYNNRVQGNVNRLQNDMNVATAKIDLFKSNDPEVKDALLEAIDDFEAMHVKLDRNGDPVEVTGNLYEFLQKRAERISRLTGVGARKQERDKTKTRARTIAKPSRVPKKPEQDPDLDAFDEEADRW